MEQYNCRRMMANLLEFSLSNWTELDVWQYLYQEKIDIVPLYFSSERKLSIGMAC